MTGSTRSSADDAAPAPHSTPPSIGVPIRVVGKNWHKRICYPAPFRSVLGRGSRSGSGRGTGPYRRMMQEQRAASRADKLMRFFMLHAWVWFMQLYVSIWAVEHVYETAWVRVTDNFCQIRLKAVIFYIWYKAEMLRTFPVRYLRAMAA